MVNKFLSLPRCTIREFAQLIGVLTAACPAVQYGWLYTKILEREKYSLLLRFDTYETKVSLSDKILDDIIWWSNNISRSSNQMRVLNYHKTLYTDASTTGWGAVCDKEKVNGHWKDSERGYHINYLELLAIYLGLKTLAKNLDNCAILLRVDNTTALSYINRMGGIQYPHLNDLTRQIWHWCEKRHIWLFASYINTKDNIEADAESRRINPDIEWELSSHAFQTIIAKLGQPQIDLFASRTNAKCQTYISWKQDPDACTVDAFTVNWKPYFFYAFPPFSLILKCVQKVIEDKAEGIIVFPIWQSQPWYPLLNKIICSEIIYLGPSKDLLHSPFRSHHPLFRSLILGAARLCGSRSTGREHRVPRST